MKEFFPALHAAALFSGISDDELATLLSCLGARIDTFPKGSRLLRAGEAVEEESVPVISNSLLCLLEILKMRASQHRSNTGHTHRQAHLPCRQPFSDFNRQRDRVAIVTKGDVCTCVHT